AYGWHVQSVEDGNDMDAIERAGRTAMAETERPSLVRVRTTIGFPAPNKKDTSSSHGAPLGAAEIEATRAVMGWPNEPFHVPAEMASVTQSVLSRGSDASRSWDAALREYRDAEGSLASEFAGVTRGELPEGWDAALPVF